MFTILAGILLLLGAATLVKLIVKIILLTARKLLTKIKERLKAKFGQRVLVMEVEKLAKQVEEEAVKKGKVKSATELLEALDGPGVLYCEINNGEVNEDSIEIIKAESIDEPLDNLLKKHNGEMIIGV